MLDIGFRPDIERILRRCPHDRQTLLLSRHDAAADMQRLAQRYMREPLTHQPRRRRRVAVEKIDQSYITVDDERKFELLLHAARAREAAAGIIFCRTKRGAERIYRKLRNARRASVDCMHGDLQQTAPRPRS